MSAATDRQRLRRLGIVLGGLSAFLFAGTIAELLSVKHYHGIVQLIPIAMCGLGLILLLLTWWTPKPAVVKVMRIAMGLIALTSLIGVYEHIEGNLGFFREIHPHAGTSELVRAALTGRDPLLAPGMLAIAAILAVAATYAAASPATQSMTAVTDLAGRREHDRQALPSR